MAKATNTDNKHKDNSRRNRAHPLSPDKRRERRQEQAIERQAAYDALSTDEKIARAVPRGGKRELARLGVEV